MSFGSRGFGKPSAGSVARHSWGWLAAMVMFGWGAAMALGANGIVGFRVCALDQLEGSLVVNCGGREFQVSPPWGRRSPFFEAYGLRQLNFYEAVPGVRSYATRIPAVSVTIPNGVERPLLLFQQAPASSTSKYNVVVVDDDWSKQPARTVRVVNLSSMLVAARVADTTLVLNPGQTELTPIANAEARHVSVRVGSRSAGIWSVDYDAIHQVLPNLRFLLVCRAAQKTDGSPGLQVSLLRDFEPRSARLLR